MLGHDAEVADWVAARIPYLSSGADFGPCAAIGVLRTDDAGLARLVGGVVYHNHVAAFRNIELSFAGEGAWLTREAICALLRYPFEQLNCQRVTACTPRRAARAIRFLNKFGFRREGVVWRMFGDDDGFVSGLRRTYWQRSKWALPLPDRRKPLGAPHGQENTASADAA